MRRDWIRAVARASVAHCACSLFELGLVAESATWFGETLLVGVGSRSVFER